MDPQRQTGHLVMNQERFSVSISDTALTDTRVKSDEKERNKTALIFCEESAKNEQWNNKYIHGTMFLLGFGSHGSVFQVTTRLYPRSKQKIAKERYTYHPDFLARYVSQRRLNMEQQDKLEDKFRDDRLFDTVAIKYEILEQSQLSDAMTRFYMFLRREFLVLDTMWRKFPRLLVGFPVVFDFGYIGGKLQYGLDPKYKNILTYINLKGEEVKFTADTHNRNLEGVTKISYMTMELLGPSINDYRVYYEPWYTESKLKTFFQVSTAFRIADQLLCRLYILHKAGFVHHDLKLDNVTVGKGRAVNTIYLIDFGFAKQVADNPVSEWMGSRKFISIDAYNSGSANYAQDVESWFYLVLSMLFDALPWADEFVMPIVGHHNTEEGSLWEMAVAIKETWWGEYSSAHSLHTMLDSVHKLHKNEVPDIKRILQQLHKKVSELRTQMREISEAKILNSELANYQSALSKGYMSIRKVLLQIFYLPNIGNNPLLGDEEFRAYQDQRRTSFCEALPWNPADYEWEWDKNHATMLKRNEATVSSDDFAAMGKGFLGSGGAGFEPTSVHNTDSVRRQLWRFAASMSLGEHRGRRRRRLQMRVVEPAAANADVGSDDFKQFGASRRQRPDEVSYVYDSGSNTLIPKYERYRRSHRAVRGQELDVGQQSSEELWQLANPSCLN